MSDIFREVEEDLRRDKAADFLRRYGSLLAVLALVLVVFFAGWRYWEHLQGERAAQAGARFEEAVRLARESKDTEADQAFQALIKDGPAGYALLSRLRVASDEAKSNPTAGITAFEAIANDGSVSQPMRNIARIRAAMLQVDRVDPKELAAKIEGLATPDGPWRAAARELLGLSNLKAGNYEAAGRWFDQIVVDAETPSAMRQRAQLYLELVQAGPVSTLPAVIAPAAPPAAPTSGAASTPATAPSAAPATSPATPAKTPAAQ